MFNKYGHWLIRTLSMKMLVSCSYGLILILALITVANLFWFFLLPAVGEDLPQVQAVVQIEKYVKRAQDSETANWGVFRKQLKLHQNKVTVLRPDENLSYLELKQIANIQEALLLFVDGNWKLYEMGLDPEDAKYSFKKALQKLEEIQDNDPDHDFVYELTIDDENDEIRVVDLSNSVAALKNLLSEQLEFLEEEYGI
ncbi:MAG TPA: hypothetical protein V6C96_02470 [Vampirovibrionales bacterium]